jgi:hypothetical protein
MMRAACILLCCVSNTIASPIALHAGDPAVDGKDWVLSDSEFRTLLAVARQKLKKSYPWVGIYRIHVLSATKVEADFGDVSEEGIGGSMDVERFSSGWRVTSNVRLSSKILFSH